MSAGEMLDILAERSFPADEVMALASRRSVGTEVSYGDRTLKVKALEHFDFSGVDICLMSAGSAVSKEWSPKIAAAGAVVIDNSSAWRYDSDVPLIVPEVNADAVVGFRKRGIIANPNCSTAQLVVALKPLHDQAKIKRVVVATYQSVSGAGKEAMDELFAQTKAVFQLNEVEAKKFPKRIAFNVIPQIDVFMEDGYTKRRVEDGGRDQEDPRSRRSSSPRPACACRSSSAIRRRSTSSSRTRSRPMRRATFCATRRAAGHRLARAGRLRDALRGGRRGRHLHQPHPRGRDRRERAVDVDRLRQSAQGRGAQRHPDRRVPDQSQADHSEAQGGVGGVPSMARARSELPV